MGQPRRPCVKLNAAVSAAVALLLTVAVIYCLRPLAGRRRDGFASRRAQEVYRTTRELFDRTGGNATYSEYKATLNDADPVLYTDVRRLWRSGRLTPEEVENVI
jgi:hypothetical protein